MVMPVNKNIHSPNENNDLKRKRSINSEDGNKNKEEISNKKFRPQHHGKNDNDDEEDNDNYQSNYSQAVDIIGNGDVDDEESCISDNSNSSGKLKKHI
jgi:hypothetical protein